MIVALIGKEIIYKTILPQTAIGNYWISDKTGKTEKKLVNISGQEGHWQVSSNSNVRIIGPVLQKNSNEVKRVNQKAIEKINLKEYDMYYVEVNNQLFVLYYAPEYEDNLMHLEIKDTQEIFIGSGPNNHIQYRSPLVSSTHARIFLNKGRWMIENLDIGVGTFVNNEPILSKMKVLFNGDIIFIMGLKIIIMGKSIYINNPLNKMEYNPKNLNLDTKEPNLLALKSGEETETELYSEKEYFARAPRIVKVIENEKVKIDSPPAVQNKEEMPILYVIGPMLGMGLMMMVSVINSVDGLMTGEGTTRDTVLSLIVAIAMLVSMMVFPILSVRYERKRKKKYEEKRQKRYKKYLDTKANQIREIMAKQKKILFENYLSAEECTQIILNRTSRLWERKIEEYDFLRVKLGIGDVPLKIDIQYPEEQFTMEDDNLIEILNNIVQKSKTIKGAPVTVSLAEKNISALVVQNKETLIEKLLQSLIVQLIAFHSYEDVKLVFLLKEDKHKKWEYIKMLPHVWNNTKEIRFFADDYSDMKEISRYLEEELQRRKSYEDNVDYRNFSPYYVIITDEYKKIENLKIITEILKSKTNMGFSILCITNDLTQLPNECKTFTVVNDNTGTIFESEMYSNSQRNFTFDNEQTIFFDKIGPALSNIPIRYTTSREMMLPSNYNFLEMYDVGLIEQLNILERWKRNDSTLSLQAPIGIDPAGMPIVLDIHERFHGPHGLIAGSTGSGKSEFIITYILSMAINYHPDDVNFILIDYKGGGLAGAFQKRGMKLPHLVGTITNIDTVGLNRSLDSIQSELRKRQIIFNEARNMTDKGTIDIYAYQKLYHDGVVSKPVPHLLIICDEFAELKQQQEEFMDELISVARIGRSLGVHLILATQKPAGIVNDQIRSNSKFGICLRVQDREDSMDVIKRPEAANLKQTGQFFMQVGNDEYFTLGQSAYSGAPYFKSDLTKKEIDNSIEIISNIGTVIKRVDDTIQKTINSDGEQLTNIVRYIHELAEEEKIQENQLWLDNIPENIYIDQVRKKYHVKKEKNNINPVIGEYDDPYNQSQGIVNLNLSKEGNTIIYGNADSGKETLLSTIVYDLITNYTVDEVNIYILDFGTEALKVFKGAPQVGDIVFINDNEKLSRLFDMLQREIKQRISILSDYNGDYNLYINTSDKPMPMTVVMINNYEAFFENYESEYDDLLLTLTREGAKCGILFILTASAYSDLRYRMTQNFKQKIVLQLNNEDDYSNILDGVRKKRPSHMFGRGLVKLGEIYEFQTAKICEPEKWNTHIKDVIEKLKQKNPVAVKNIPILPEVVTFKDIKEAFKGITSVPLGISKKSMNIITYDFKKNFMSMVTSKNIEVAIEYITHIIDELKQLMDINLVILDAERIYQMPRDSLSENYRKLSFEIEKEIQNNKHTISVIIGVDKFLNEIEEGEFGFNAILQKAQQIGNYSFVIVDNVNRIKNHEYEEWFKNYVPRDKGIWVGNGVNDQYLISVNSEDRGATNNCGNSFGCIINQENPIVVKLIGMKEKGDENE